MTGKDIIRKVKHANFPKGSYVVFGSCPMALAGIRESSDIDMLVSDELFKELDRSDWSELVKGPDDKPMVYEDFEASNNWHFGTYNPTLEQLLSTATEVDGVPFVSLEEVKKWKTASGRPKDIVDIKLIDDYLNKQD